MIRTKRSRRKTPRERHQFSSVRLVVGFARILLVAEGASACDYCIVDCFPLNDERDNDLLLVVSQMRRLGYGNRYLIKGNLSPALFSANGAREPESRAAMERLRRRGFAVSAEVSAITDRLFLELADGSPRAHHSLKSGA